MERYQIANNQFGFDSCVVVSARYNAADKLLDEETLYPALTSVILQQGALSSQIITSGKSRSAPVFVRLPTILLDDVVTFVEEELTDYDATMSRLLEAQIAQPFEMGSSSPLWHLTVVSKHTVIFKYCHAIGDGQSGLAFHRALLSALNSPQVAGGTTQPKVSIPDSTSLVPPVETMMNVSVPFGAFCHSILETFLPSAKKSRAWTGNPIPRTPSVVTNVRCWEISSSDAALLLALCRKHQATLTSFLHTLLVGVFSKRVASLNAEGRKDKKKKKKAYKTIASYMPISLRRFTGVSPYDMCVHVSTFHFWTPLAPFPDSGISYADFPWSTASALASKLRTSGLTTRTLIGMIRYLFALGLAESYWLGSLGQKREGGFEISNPGRFPSPQKEGEDDENAMWRISNVYFAQCDAVAGSALKHNVVGSPTGTVNLTFTWGPASLENEFVEEVIKEVKACLSSILTSSATTEEN